MSDNPSCPICSHAMTENGTKPSGAKEYRCRRCKKTRTDSDRPSGGQCVGDRKLTQAERTARWKANDPEGYKASMKRRQERRKQKNAKTVTE